MTLRIVMMPKIVNSNDTKGTEYINIKNNLKIL